MRFLTQTSLTPSQDPFFSLSLSLPSQVLLPEAPFFQLRFHFKKKKKKHTHTHNQKTNSFSQPTPELQEGSQARRVGGAERRLATACLSHLPQNISGHRRQQLTFWVAAVEPFCMGIFAYMHPQYQSYTRMCIFQMMEPAYKTELSLI